MASCVGVTFVMKSTLPLQEYDAIRRSHGVATLDSQGAFVLVNENFCGWLGFRVDELNGKDYSMVLCIDSKEYDVLWKNLLVGQVFSGEYRFRHREERDVWLRVTLSPIMEDSTCVGVVLCAVDIPKEKTATQFLANMSHEIRTPMNGIFGTLSLLQGLPLSEKARGYVDVCSQAAESLLAVLDDVLLFAQTEEHAIKLEHTPFNLISLVEDCLFIASENVSREQDVEMTCLFGPSVPLSLIGDPSRLRQILQNLLINAVKFTERGHIGLSVKVSSRDPLLLLFEVSDTGIGISEEDQKLLFAPFSQTDSSLRRKVSGSGLGLAICKRLVALFGGETGVVSKLGEGSKFWFTAHFGESNSNLFVSLGVEVTEQLLLHTLRVLVIDDNATNCLALKSTLELFGTYCETVLNGVEGLRLLKQAMETDKAFDFVLLDYWMPGMDGIDVAKAIKAQHGNSGKMPKIIVLNSGLDHKGLKDESFIAAFVTKPFRCGQLLHTICRIAEEEGALPKRGNSAPGKLEHDFKGFSVLLVEDNETNRLVARDLLELVHFTVVEAHNGAEAVEMMNAGVSLVLMDVHMPVLDGIAATRILKERYSRVPFVMLTADNTEDTRKKCGDAGAASVLLKPCKKKALLNLLADILSPTKSTKKAVVRVLVAVEEENCRITVAQCVEKTLERVNVHLVIVGSGEEAVACAKASSNAFDWCLMDVAMPGIGGVAAARQIVSFWSGLRIIGVAGAGVPYMLKDCIDAGMEKVLSLPLTPQQLEFMRHTMKPEPAAPPAVEENLFDGDFLSDLDPEEKRIILAGWKDESVVALKDLEALLLAEDWQQLEEVAHSLKGSSAQVGATRAGASAKRIEFSAKERIAKMEISRLIDEVTIVLQSTFVFLGI